MTTILLPFYHKLEEFALAFEWNKKYLTHQHEILVVIDEPESHREVRKILDVHSVFCREIHNPNPHEWRNPAKAINVGIRQAQGETIIVMSPETVCGTDIYAKLEEALTETTAYSFGQTILLQPGERPTNNPEAVFDGPPDHYITNYGSICFRRSDAIAVKGYNEQLTKWGYEDDEFRARLAGHTKGIPVCVPLAKGVHLWHTGTARTGFDNRDIPIVPNNDEWGRDFDPHKCKHNQGR